MKKFLVLYKSSVPAAQQMAGASAEQLKAGMDLLKSWAQQAQRSIVDLGMPLGNPTNIEGTSVLPGESKVAGFHSAGRVTKGPHRSSAEASASPHAGRVDRSPRNDAGTGNVAAAAVA